MIRKCFVCKKEFKTYPSKVKIGRGKYCSKKCSYIITNKNLKKVACLSMKGRDPWNKKGWSITRARKNGKKYKLILCKDHPSATAKGYIREHRLVMEKHIGRVLNKDEIVHHKNGDTLDNRIENLELMTRKEHSRLHTKDNVHKRWQKK
jgi:hypothetical protein